MKKRRKNNLILAAGLILMAVVTIVVCVVPLRSNASEKEQLDYDDLHSAMPCLAPLYTVNGQMMPVEDQEYVYYCCRKYGIEEYYPYWLCEIYQESGFQWDATDGESFGYCQLNGRYHSWFAREAGLPEDADLINDRKANIMAGTAYFAGSLIDCGYNLEYAVRTYYNSGDLYADAAYVTQVTQWYDTLEQIR